MRRLRRLYHLLRRYRRLDARRRGLLIEASSFLLISRLALIGVPFRRLAPRLGRLADVTEAHPQLSADQTLPAAAIAAEIGWAVTRAARYVPFKAVCLPQAMAARLMLQRRHVASVMHFGVARSEEKPLEAHAWLDAAGTEVVGYPATRFNEIARFL